MRHTDDTISFITKEYERFFEQRFCPLLLTGKMQK